MATSFDKNDKTARRAVADDIRKQQQRAERRKNMSIVGVAVFIALALVGSVAVFMTDLPYVSVKWWDLKQFNDKDLASIGAPATVCQKATTKDATGSGKHVPEGQKVLYQDAPPTFGEHYPAPDPMERKLYTADDRPPLEVLVHNLEHGYTILWYDTTIAGDQTQMDQLTAIAKKLEGTGNFRLKFKAVPWLPTDEDGKTFPEGEHVALTHWSAGGVGDAATGKQVGVTQFCSAVSGQALSDFMLKYPYLDSPEPTAS